ncbi:biotin/lipoyl-binding protein [Rhodanobacter sp. BL-MT-08]
MKTATLVRFVVTFVVLLAAVVVGHTLWKHYMYSPWTRDGRVRAEIVRIAPDVSGLVTKVNVIDNQTVKKGDLLFEIDPSRYQNALDLAKANVGVAQAAARAAKANVEAAAAGAAQSKSSYGMAAEQSSRRQRLSDVVSEEARADARSAADAARAGLDKAQAGLDQAMAAEQQAQAAVTQAQVAVAAAQLNLDRTEVRAPTDGYVTNLLVRVGDYASAGAPRMALIDSHSYWVYGYFEETKLPQVRIGDAVDIRLMSGGVRLHGKVQSIARGITDAGSPTGSDLLSDVNPTFNWVRLAQRVPVRVAIDTDHLPAGTVLAAGMTATLIVHPHKADDANTTAAATP